MVDHKDLVVSSVVDTVPSRGLSLCSYFCQILGSVSLVIKESDDLITSRVKELC